MWRFEIINYLIQKYGFTRYLEIGVENGHSVNGVKCDLKHGVDPYSNKATFQVESDLFFSMIRPEVKYDLIFIDGLHLEDQVDRDIQNSLEHLSPGGMIVVHDCNPPSEWHQRDYQTAKKNGFRQWNGTVWRSMVKLRATRSDLIVQVVDTDWGCGIIRRLADLDEESQVDLIQLPHQLDYQWLSQNRSRALGLISEDIFKAIY